MVNINKNEKDNTIEGQQTCFVELMLQIMDSVSLMIYCVESLTFECKNFHNKCFGRVFKKK